MFTLLQNPYKDKSIHDPEQRLTFSWVLHRIKELSKGSSALDLGIGFGQVTVGLAEHFSFYKVVEGSKAVIDGFLGHYPFNPDCISHGLFEEYEPCERFDVVIMNFILEHVKDPRCLLTRYKEFLNPGGQLFISVPNALSLHRRLGLEAGYLDDCYALSDYDLKVGHLRYFDAHYLVELVEGAGYNILNLEGIYLKPFTSAQLNSLDLPEEVQMALLKVGQSLPEYSNSLFLNALAD